MFYFDIRAEDRARYEPLVLKRIESWTAIIILQIRVSQIFSPDDVQVG
jgi:hypothetical protein